MTLNSTTLRDMKFRLVFSIFNITGYRLLQLEIKQLLIFIYIHNIKVFTFDRILFGARSLLLVNVLVHPLVFIAVSLSLPHTYKSIAFISYNVSCFIKMT